MTPHKVSASVLWTETCYAEKISPRNSFTAMTVLIEIRSHQVCTAVPSLPLSSQATGQAVLHNEVHESPNGALRNMLNLIAAQNRLHLKYKTLL